MIPALAPLTVTEKVLKTIDEIENTPFPEIAFGECNDATDDVDRALDKIPMPFGMIVVAAIPFFMIKHDIQAELMRHRLPQIKSAILKTDQVMQKYVSQGELVALPTRLPCKHTYDYTFLKERIKNLSGSPLCPLCEMPFKKEEMEIKELDVAVLYRRVKKLEAHFLSLSLPQRVKRDLTKWFSELKTKGLAFYEARKALWKDALDQKIIDRQKFNKMCNELNQLFLYQTAFVRNEKTAQTKVK